ncbi:MAG: LysR family transcriptional regulator [Sneathiellaceae bacterium]
MSWDDIDIFCQVVSQGSFTAAARAANRPKSSVSAAVMRLEASLNVRLLDRSTRRLRVTEAGAALFNGAAPALQDLRQVALQARERGGSIGGRLRIAAPYEFGAHHLGAVSCRMMDLHPELEIVLDVVHASVDPIGGGYDIQFSMTDRDLAASGIVAARVFTLDRGLFAAPGLLARHPPVRQPQDLARMPLLAGAGDDAWQFSGAADGGTSVPVRQPRLRSANAGVRKQAALAGIGIARITATYCAEEVRQGSLAEVLPGQGCAPLQVHALLPARRLVPAPVRAFLDTLAEMTGAGARNRR